MIHDDVIKRKHFPCYWPFVWEIHRSPVNSPYKGQWRRALMFSLICAWINGWVNNREAADLRHHRVHYDVTVMSTGRGINTKCSSCPICLEKDYGCMVFSRSVDIWALGISGEILISHRTKMKIQSLMSMRLRQTLCLTYLFHLRNIFRAKQAT